MDKRDRFDDVIEYLRKAGEARGVTQIVLDLKVTRNTVLKHLRYGIKKGYIVSQFGPRNSKTYLLLSEKPQSDSPVGQYTREIKSESLLLLVKSWSEQQWKPNVFKSYKNLPYVLSRLYHLAWEQSTGGSIAQTDINGLREQLAEFQGDLVNALRTVNGILDTKELWNSSTFASYILSPGGNPDEYRKLAQDLKDNN